MNISLVSSSVSSAYHIFLQTVLMCGAGRVSDAKQIVAKMHCRVGIPKGPASSVPHHSSQSRTILKLLPPSASSTSCLHCTVACRLMAASTATAPLTPFLHSHKARSRRRARFIVAVSTPDAEPSQEAAPGKKKTVDTRIHWSDPDEGWVGGKEKNEGDGRKNEPLGRRFADLINNPTSESHYQLSPPLQQNSPHNPYPFFSEASPVNQVPRNRAGG